MGLPATWAFNVASCPVFVSLLLLLLLFFVLSFEIAVGVVPVARATH